MDDNVKRTAKAPALVILASFVIVVEQVQVKQLF
jgi:hypothetical protein